MSLHHVSYFLLSRILSSKKALSISSWMFKSSRSPHKMKREIVNQEGTGSASNGVRHESLQERKEDVPTHMMYTMYKHNILCDLRFWCRFLSQEVNHEKRRHGKITWESEWESEWQRGFSCNLRSWREEVTWEDLSHDERNKGSLIVVSITRQLHRPRRYTLSIGQD